MAPGFRAMFTPAIDAEAGSSRAVVSRAHPPFERRLCERENDHFRFGTVPRSVLGGVRTSGFCLSRGRLRGPVSVAPLPSFVIGSITSLASSFDEFNGTTSRSADLIYDFSRFSAW